MWQTKIACTIFQTVSFWQTRNNMRYYNFFMKSVLLQETLHIYNGSNESHEDIEALENGTTVKRIQKNGSLFLNWPLMSSIIVYCFFALHNIAYQEVCFLLYAERPIFYVFHFFLSFVFCFSVSFALYFIIHTSILFWSLNNAL